MQDRDRCERHPEEAVAANCINCNRGICRICREEFGYFCSEECREQAKQETESLVEPEEEEEYAVLDRKVNRWMRVISRLILPGIVVLLALFIAYKVTSKAGKVLWEFKPAEDKPFSPLTSSRENIYAGCDDGMLYCINGQEGTARWKLKLAEVKPRDSRTAAGFGLRGGGSLCLITKPVIVGDNLCITWDEDTVYAVDTDKGALVWKRTFTGKVTGAPVIGSNSVYYISNFYRDLTQEERKKQRTSSFKGFFPFGGGAAVAKVRTASSIYALSCTDGHDIWERKLDKLTYPGHLASGENTLYLSLRGTGENGTWGYTLLAIDDKSGKGKWKAQLSSGSLSAIYPQEDGVLAVSQENLYFISAEGKEIWRRNKEETGFQKPIVAESKIYFKEDKDKLTCAELATGKRTWTAEVAPETSAPVIGEGFVFLQGFIEKPLKKSKKKQVGMPSRRAPGLGDDFMKQFTDQAEPLVKRIPVLYVLDSKTGKALWAKENIGGEMLYKSGKIFLVKTSTWFGLLDQKTEMFNRITAIDVRKGKMLWQYSHKGLVGSMTVDEGKFYFTSSSSAMHIGSMFSGRKRKPTDNTIYALSIGR
jgi:outer membrane protein assembly factor BamB